MASGFLKVMKIYNGKISNVIVLAEQEFSGWMNFEKCLKSFFIRKTSNSKVSTNRSNINQKLYPGQQVGPILKVASLVVVIFKYSSYISWELVMIQMQKKLGRLAEAVPFADDRAVVWCDSEENRSPCWRRETYTEDVYS